jgi:hypothetical protein
MRRIVIAAALLALTGCAAYQADQIASDPIFRACHYQSGVSPDAVGNCIALDGVGGAQTMACERQLMTTEQVERITNCLTQASAIHEMLTPPPAPVVMQRPSYTNCTTIDFSTTCTTW